MKKCKNCKHWSSPGIIERDWTNDICGDCHNPKIARGETEINKHIKVFVLTEWHTPIFMTTQNFGCILFESK